MSAERSIPEEGRLADPAAWADESAEDVEPRPSGMVVFSLRLPADEFRQLKEEAERRQTTMSELARAALRFYLQPRATGSLSVTAFHHIQVSSFTPVWTGGIADPVTVDRGTTPTSAPPLGNVIPRQ